MEYPAPQGFIELVQRRYDLKVIDSHYILVDAKFQKYNMMLDVQFNDEMKQKFMQLYGKQDSAMYVEWEVRDKTDSIRFFAEKGNNILLLWDTLQQK